MSTKYEIRQQVRTVVMSRLEPIDSFGADYVRAARNAYERLRATYPSEYFELVKVTVEEECLDHTGNAT